MSAPNGAVRPSIPTAVFGRTGHRSTRVIFGAAALGFMGDEYAAEVLGVLDEYGINHIDTAATYGDSELRVAPWLVGRRDDFFLATKTAERTGDAARAGLERSLGRLGVDSVDLVQLHNLVEPEEWETAHGPGGAVEALVQARDEGLTRAIGVTGHGLRIAGMHRRSLERFDFDSVLLPFSFPLLAIESYRTEVTELLAECASRQVAVQTIKSVARRRWVSDDDPHYSWYEPLRDVAAVGRAVRWVLSHGQVFLNSSSDVSLLRPTLETAAAGLGPPSDDGMRADTTQQGIVPLFDGHAVERI